MNPLPLSTLPLNTLPLNTLPLSPLALNRQDIVQNGNTNLGLTNGISPGYISILNFEDRPLQKISELNVIKGKNYMNSPLSNQINLSGYSSKSGEMAINKKNQINVSKEMFGDTISRRFIVINTLLIEDKKKMNGITLYSSK